MSVETIPRPAIDYEPVPVLSYKEYRGLCDGMQPEIYRTTGISEEEGYQAASEDNRTVFVELNGRRLPLFVSLEHVGGYVIDKTKALLGDVESVYALALPPGFTEGMDIDLEEHARQLGENTAIIVETARENTQAIKDIYTGRLGESGWAVHDFLDERLEGMPDEERMARVTLFTAHFEAQDDEGNLIPHRGLSLEELYAEEVAENGVTNTEIFNGLEIAEDARFLRQLWELHDTKFDELGKYHPLSMQEDENFFRGLITKKHAKSIVRFKEDENGNKVPVCQGIMLEDPKQEEWVSDHSKEALAEEAKRNGEYMMFYYGIASKSTLEEQAGYAKDVIGLCLRAFKRNGGKLMLPFECPTMSGHFIPRLVGDYARAEPEGVTITQEAKPVSQVDYWALVSRSRETVN